MADQVQSTPGTVHKAPDALNSAADCTTPFVGPPLHPGRQTFEHALYWADRALYWRKRKAQRLANPLLFNEYTPGWYEARARKAEKLVREAAGRAEGALRRQGGAS